MSEKAETVSIADLSVSTAIKQKIKSLGLSIAEINLELSLLEEIKESQMEIIRDLAAEHDLPNIKSDKFTLSLSQGRLILKEQLLLEEGIPASVIESCKERGNPYWQVKRVKNKKDGNE